MHHLLIPLPRVVPRVRRKLPALVKSALVYYAWSVPRVEIHEVAVIHFY